MYITGAFGSYLHGLENKGITGRFEDLHDARVFFFGAIICAIKIE